MLSACVVFSAGYSKLQAHFFAVMACSSFIVARLGSSFDERAVNMVIKQSIMDLVDGHPTDEQTEAVKTFLGGKDVFVCLPTGSGKSVCFTCLPQVIVLCWLL